MFSHETLKSSLNLRMHTCLCIFSLAECWFLPLCRRSVWYLFKALFVPFLLRLYRIQKVCIGSGIKETGAKKEVIKLILLLGEFLP